MRTALNKYTLVFIAVISFSNTYAQHDLPVLKLDLNQAIEKGMKHNKGLLQEKRHLNITNAEEKDLKLEQLPDIKFGTDFSVLSNLNQFENGVLNPSTKYAVPRLKYDFTLSAEIEIYAGGKMKYNKGRAALDTKKQEYQFRMDERKLQLQIITAFLQVLHLQEQQNLINVKVREDKVNIKQVKLLRTNGLVTGNEVLRTELQLSNHLLSATELSTEVAIIQEQVKPLLGIEEDVSLELDTKGILETPMRNEVISSAKELAFESNEKLQMHRLDLQKSQLDKKSTKANILPKILGEASYGYNYPNFMFFPPEPYLYRFGLAGIKVAFPIGNLYKNKQKVRIADERIKIASLKIEEEEEEIKAGLFTAEKKLALTVSKIQIAEEAIIQAKENYRVVQTKYGNQLSLITELIDADNAYLEARSKLISLNIDKQLKYYQLQYILGKL